MSPTTPQVSATAAMMPPTVVHHRVAQQRCDAARGQAEAEVEDQQVRSPLADGQQAGLGTGLGTERATIEAHRRLGHGHLCRIG